MKRALLIVISIFICILSLYGQEFEFIDGTDYLPLLQDSLTYRQIGGKDISSRGNIRACFIFVNAPNDHTTYSNEWREGTFPDYRNHYVDSQLNNGAPFEYSNISNYIYSMSHGLNQLYGDVYTYTLPQNIESPINPQALSRTVLMGMDETIDYSLYDNWTKNSNYNFSNTPDGIVDMIFIIYRFKFEDWGGSYTAIAENIVNGDYISADGVTISQQQSGVCQGAGGYGFDSSKYVSLHEYQHFLFPFFHNGRLCNLSGLSSNEVGWNASRGMCAWERERLGWINYTVASTDEIITLPDYMTSHVAIRISTPDSKKYYIMENRQRKSVFDGAYDKGLYIYKVDEDGIQWNGTYYDGKVQVLSADGRYDFTSNVEQATSSNQVQLFRGEPNPYGFDERDFFCRLYLNGYQGRYYCSNAWYHGDSRDGHGYYLGDAWGDDYDAYNMDFNKVFSKWSNPGLDPNYNADFSITVINEDVVSGAVTFQLRFTNPSDAPLARPMGLDGTSPNGVNFNLHWHQPNIEIQPGFATYQLEHRRSLTAGWNLITTTPNTNVSLSIPYNNNSNAYRISKRNYFRVRGIKFVPGGESNFSDELKLVNSDYIMKEYRLPANRTLAIDDSVTVHITDKLLIGDNSSLLLGKGSQLFIDSGASIVIGDNCIVKGTNKSSGNDKGSRLVVSGSMSMGNNANFTTDDCPWDGLVLETTDQVNIEDATFTKASLLTYSNLNISNCEFNESDITQYGNDITILNSNFNNAHVKSFAKFEKSSLNVQNCIMNGDNVNNAIELTSLSKYDISGNQISNYQTAIAVYESHNGDINENHIFGNVVGIQLYHAAADIYRANVIEQNRYGIVAMRNSLWSLEGTKEPPYQKIIDNAEVQLLFTYDSAPDYAEFNEIYSSIAPEKAYIICENISGNSKKILISNNYYGPKFEVASNLIPELVFDYQAIWLPESLGLNDSKVPSVYMNVKLLERSSDYLGAKSLIYQYVTTSLDTTMLYDKALNKLLSLEEITTENYYQLMDYYTHTNTPIFSTLNLLQYLVNYCDIEDNNLQDALVWLETQINNPISSVDSLFAMIDIGYVTLLSENNRSIAQGNYLEYNPISLIAYENNRKSALGRFISGFNNDQRIQNPTNSLISFVGNYPNPFNPSTTLKFNVRNKADCKLEIFNVKGQRVRFLCEETKMPGSYYTVWDGRDDSGQQVGSGLYIFRILTPNGSSIAKILMLK